MEPMVVFALGIVVYCGYLTVKDFVADLHQEGFMVRSLFNKCLGCMFVNTFWRFFFTRSWSRSRIVTNSPIFLYYRPVPPLPSQLRGRLFNSGEFGYRDK